MRKSWTRILLLLKMQQVEHRMQQQSRQLDELRQTVKLLGNVIERKALNTEEATGLLKALTVMIAESKPEEKDMMAKVVVNLINLKN